jgi:hypothetical protein
MSDIFVSYASEDRPKAKLLAEALAARGWSVFWDRTIPVAETWEEVLERELGKAKCVVVLWSQKSVKSDWVRAEAADAAERKALVPTLIDEVRPPLRYRHLQAAQLAEWRKGSPNPEFDRLVRAIEAKAGVPSKAIPPRISASREPSEPTPITWMKCTSSRLSGLQVA